MGVAVGSSPNIPSTEDRRRQFALRVSGEFRHSSPLNDSDLKGAESHLEINESGEDTARRKPQELNQGAVIILRHERGRSFISEDGTRRKALTQR